MVTIQEEQQMAHVRVLSRFAAEYAALTLKQRSILDNEQFVRAAYRVLLKREPDASGMEHYLWGLEHKTFGKLDMLRGILNSQEFQQSYGSTMSPMESLHRARILLFQQCLPPADFILDLGGAAHDNPEGALRAMGYPYRPREIHIVDLPPDDRIGGAQRAEGQQIVMTEDGVQIRYVYSSMSELGEFGNASIDLIVSGESIEHISEAEADIVCHEAFRILKEGGHFCLDTPNGALTRLQSPDTMIHPEHQKEYLVHEIREKLITAGFQIVDAKGICPMPQSLQRKEFSYKELGQGPRLSDKPEEGYLFFFNAVKPPRTNQPI
jgi:SAM-dependent methyltransferase